MDSKTSILIQGPLDKVSIAQIPYYQTIGPVIVSCWSNNDLTLLDGQSVDIVSINVDLITNNYRQETADRQFLGVYKGLCQVKTDYVIRTRADERWSNLHKLINMANDQKIVTGNMFFRPWSSQQCHPGDHIFIGKTSILKEAYRLLLEKFIDYKELYCAEQSLAHAVIRAYGYSGDIDKNKFLEHWDLININELTPFVAQYRHASKIYTDDFSDDGYLQNIKEL